MLFTSLGICASCESWAEIGHIHCWPSSRFICASDTTGKPPHSHPEEGDRVTQRLLLNIQSSQHHVTRVEGKCLRSTIRWMFIYPQVLYATTPLYSWHLCLPCLFELMFFSNQVACWRSGCQNTAFLIPLLCTNRVRVDRKQEKNLGTFETNSLLMDWAAVWGSNRFGHGAHPGGLSSQHVCVLVSLFAEPITQRSSPVLYIYAN